MVPEAFWNAFCAVLGREVGIAVVHSSLANLAPPADFQKSNVLDPLNRLIEAGWTIALPAFTFSFCRGLPFDAAQPVGSGPVGRLVPRSAPASRRTPHPIYSFAVAGPAADRICDCPSATTFGDDSPFGLFEREDATLVMLGCGWKYCTQFHRYEEQAAVPYRYYKEFVGQADFADGRGEHEARAKMYVRELAINPTNDFTSAEQRLRDEGRIASVPLLRREVEAARVRDVAGVSRELLRADPLALLSNRAEVERALKVRAGAAQKPAFKVAVLGHSNLHLLRSALAGELAPLLPDRILEPYDVRCRRAQMAIDGSSPLRRFEPHVSVFCDRLEDSVSPGSIESLTPRRSPIVWGNMPT